MAKPQSKDDALEALDFIVNVLKEHEKDLDKLISELATVTEQIGDTSELTVKVEAVEEKINTLQREVTTLIGCISSTPRQPLPTGAAVKETAAQTIASPSAVPLPASGSCLTLRCKQWEDFLTMASGAQTVSFSYKENEKILQSDALRGNQVISYSGAPPRFEGVFKMYLSKVLGVSEKSILEGELAAQ